MKTARKTVLYLFDDKYMALSWFITQTYGLEVPYDFKMPECKFLPKKVPMYGIGETIPARWLITLWEDTK